MKYLVFILCALVLNACSLSRYNPQPQAEEPAADTPKVELKDERPTLTPPIEAKTGDIHSEEIKPANPDDASTNTEDVTQGQFSYIDQKYGDKKDDQTKVVPEKDTTGDDLAVQLTDTKAKKKLDGVSPEKALMYLEHGNTRFLKGHLRKDGQSKKDIKRLAKAEKPHAIIFTTSDSRVSPEIIFDEKLGEVFVVRAFGLKVDSAVLNSLEYATQYLGTRLIIVMDRNYPGNNSAEFTHAKEVTDKILSQSPVLQNYSTTGQLKIVPAIYSLESGKVAFSK
jgi:carbonic anhydrase